MFGKKTRQYERLVEQIKRCPDKEIGTWAAETMEMLVKARGRDAAIHFAGLLVSGAAGGFRDNLDLCLAYLQHVIDDEGGGSSG